MGGGEGLSLIVQTGTLKSSRLPRREASRSDANISSFHIENIEGVLANYFSILFSAQRSRHHRIGGGETTSSPSSIHYSSSLPDADDAAAGYEEDFYSDYNADVLTRHSEWQINFSLIASNARRFKTRALALYHIPLRSRINGV